MVLHNSKQQSGSEEIKLEKSKESYWLRPFWFTTQGQKIFPDMSFSQNNDPKQYLKKHFQRNLRIKLSKKLKNFIGPLFQ